MSHNNVSQQCLTTMSHNVSQYLKYLTKMSYYVLQKCVTMSYRDVLQCLTEMSYNVLQKCVTMMAYNDPDLTNSCFLAAFFSLPAPPAPRFLLVQF